MHRSVHSGTYSTELGLGNNAKINTWRSDLDSENKCNVVQMGGSNV